MTKRSFAEKGINGLLVHFGSVQAMVEAMFPSDHKALYPWRFASAPNGYWKLPENRKYAAAALRTHLGIVKATDWYALTREALIEFGIVHMVDHYAARSLHSMLQEAYPEEYADLRPWLFVGGAPKGFWTNEANLRLAAESIRADLGIRRPRDWIDAGLSRETFREMGLSTLLNIYSVQSFLSTHFPSDFAALEPLEGPKKHPWQDSRGNRPDWRCPMVCSAAMEKLSRRLAVQHPQDWYSLTAGDFLSQKGSWAC